MKRAHERARLGGATAICLLLLGMFGSIALATGAGADPTTTTTTTTTTTAPAGPICPSDSANGRFVRWIYIQILNRCPDDAGAAYWTAKLDDGLPDWTFTEAIDMSTENVVDNNVDEIYEQILGRMPSAGELAAGISDIRTNHQDALLISQLVSSDEFYATIVESTTAARDQYFLNLAYNKVLERDPDSAGLAYYTAMFGSGGSTEATRHQVMLDLELSTENMQDWTGSVYGAALNRGPDAAGFAFWVGWLQGVGKHHTFQMWTHMLASSEGYGIAQTQPNPSGPDIAAAQHR